jgi:hypothetical protein
MPIGKASRSTLRCVHSLWSSSHLVPKTTDASQENIRLLLKSRRPHETLEYTHRSQGQVTRSTAVLKQTGSIQDYVFAFSQLTSKLHLSDDEGVDRFHRGLKTIPKQEFLRLGPTPETPNDSFERAIHVERLLTHLRKPLLNLSRDGKLPL